MQKAQTETISFDPMQYHTPSRLTYLWVKCVMKMLIDEPELLVSAYVYKASSKKNLAFIEFSFLSLVGLQILIFLAPLPECCNHRHCKIAVGVRRAGD